MHVDNALYYVSGFEASVAKAAHGRTSKRQLVHDLIKGLAGSSASMNTP